VFQIAQTTASEQTPERLPIAARSRRDDMLCSSPLALLALGLKVDNQVASNVGVSAPMLRINAVPGKTCEHLPMAARCRRDDTLCSSPPGLRVSNRVTISPSEDQTGTPFSFSDILTAKKIVHRVAEPPKGEVQINTYARRPTRVVKVQKSVRSARAPKESSQGIRRRRRNSVVMRQIRANNMGRQGEE